MNGKWSFHVRLYSAGAGLTNRSKGCERVVAKLTGGPVRADCGAFPAR